VLVIDANGEKLGVMSTSEALRRAQDAGLNLVEVAPNVRPPVCKILDYGRYKYDLKQDAKRKKRNQVVIEVKEVKFRPKVDKHDYDFKVRHVLRFLREGNKVKCTIMFRGREMAHTEIGEAVLKRVLSEFDGKVSVDSAPKLEGRNMSMQISPRPGAFKKPEKSEDHIKSDKSKKRKGDSENPEVDEKNASSDAEPSDSADGDVTASA